MSAGGSQAAVHLQQECGNPLKRGLASQQQHVVLGMLKIAGRHIQKVERDHRVAFRDMFKAAPLHQPYCRIDDRLRGEAVLGTVFQTKNVAGQMEGADLAAAVGKELVAANRAFNDLVDVFGRLGLAVDFGTSVVFEFAQDDPCAGKLAKLSESLRLAAGMGVDVDKHGCLPV